MYTFAPYIIIPTVFLIICIRKYQERTWGKCKNNVKLTGKVAIVTGANSGIGYEIAKELAIRGAQVIMACRDLDRAAKAICKIKRELQCSSVIIPMELDLGSIESIKNFCEEITSTYSQIDILVNNAGVSYPKHIRREKTKDGFEINFGVNYLGHFVLTNLLITPLHNSESSRIIVISSSLYKNGKIHLYDLNLERVTDKTDGYVNSKLANMYFCKELAKRVHGTSIHVYAVCPGWVYTNLFRHQRLEWYHIFLLLPIALLFMRSPKQGAQTAIHCATELNLKHGCIYRNCEIYNSKFEFDAVLSHKLWNASQEMAEEVDDSLRIGRLYEMPLL